MTGTVWCLVTSSLCCDKLTRADWVLQPMTEAGLVDAFIDVLVCFTTVRPLPRPAILASLPSQPTALQALYSTRKKLSGSQWHVYAVEHMLPTAFILGHPGMGALLQTFYRKKKDSDNGHAPLMAMAESADAWRVGQVCLATGRNSNAKQQFAGLECLC